MDIKLDEGFLFGMGVFLSKRLQWNKADRYFWNNI